jgi:hypothetical protein
LSDISNNVRYLRALKVKSAGVPVKNPPGDLFDRPRHGDGPAPWNHSVEIDQTSRYLAGESCPPAWSSRRPGFHNGSEIVVPQGRPHVFRLLTSWTGRRLAATPHFPRG